MTQLSSCGFYVLRRAVLPVTTLETIHRQESLDGLHVQLRRLFAEPIWQEAIYIASPEFYKRFVGWLAGKQTDDADKIAVTLYKYLVRMCTRCTPYGLFAGCSTGAVASQTAIQFVSDDTYRKFSRLDMEFLSELTESILASDPVQASLRYIPNKMLYEVDNKYRFSERLTEENGQMFRISSIEKSDYIDAVLKTAKTGATRQELVGSLVAEGVTEEDAFPFVDELIEVQLLVSELSPTLTGDDYLLRFCDRVQTDFPQLPRLPGVLNQIQELLQRQDTAVTKYEQIASLADQLTETQSQNRVQVDLFYNTSVNTLGREAVSRITRQLEKLTVLGRRYELTELQAFKKRFHSRYEQQEVPLWIALDGELGVGYDSLQYNIGFQPLIDDITWPDGATRKTIPWSSLQALVYQKYTEAVEQRRMVITLTNADLATLQQETPDVRLPNSLYAFGNLLAASEQTIDQGDFLFNLNGCTGPSSASILGRFCQGDAGLAERVAHELAEEEARNPHAVFAEVIHLPETRVGNVLRRPVLRKYEIPYLTDSVLDEAHQLPISDLMVSIREDGRVMLRSVKLNKEVIPCLTTAHNFSNGLPIYRFLCELQYQDVGMNMGWDWGLLTNQTFLPRVQYENILISRATWNLIQPAAGVSKKELDRLITDLRARYFLPQYVVVVQGDNELLIDTHNPLSLDLLQTELAKRDRLVLKEFLFTATNRFLRDEVGEYANEIVLPLKTTVENRVTTVLPLDLSGQIQRKFSLGSEWLFVKIYAGEKIAETILSNFIKPLIKQLTDEKLIDKWFFIRYADPEPHLRIRFHGDPAQNFFVRIIEYINAISHEYIQNHVIIRIQYDTYNREVERYGERTIERCEELFHHDSEAVLAMIAAFTVDDETERQRWLIGVMDIDELLNDADYQLADKINLMARLQQLFMTEFGDTPGLRRQLNQKYRDLKPMLDDSLTKAPGDNGFLNFFRSVLTDRSKQQRTLLQTLTTTHGQQTVETLMPSLVHMCLNRLFFANQRSHELVIYHFLHKFYASAQARSKQTVVC